MFRKHGICDTIINVSCFENVHARLRMSPLFPLRNIASQSPWITVLKFIFRKHRWRRRLFSGNKIKTISWHWWSTEWLCHFVVKLRPKQSQKYEHRNWNTNKFFTGYKHRLQNSKWKTDFTMELIKWKDQPQSKERILFLVKPFISLAFILNSNVSNQR